VTGATSGIGEVTARELARDGGTVVILARSRTKGEATRSFIRTATGNDKIELVLADFESLSDVRRAATELLERFPRLDVLVNNAGAIQTAFSETRDGIETTFGVNHLAPFLLTSLLLDRLKASGPSRIVNVASRAHIRTKLRLDDLEGRTKYSAWHAYCQSKLCNVLFTYELARRLEGTQVTANCLHPGVITSGFGKNRPGLFNLAIRIAGPFMWTPEKGARTSLKLARAPELAGVTGKYFDDDGKEVRSSRVSYDQDLQRKLWDVSMKKTGLA
jgi:NAD(P)-dependent dehydrogenase (short-subunit alcohol dehydrogenase family)